MAVIACANACTRSDESGIERRARTAAGPNAARLRQLVEQLRGDAGVPGLSVAIAQGGQGTVVATAGLADRAGRVPVTPETAFFIGSVSKNVFATIALQLVDQGRLRLDSPLSDFVEWPRGREITVRMLLNHTSGIPEYLTRDKFERSPDGGIPEFFRIPRPPDSLLAGMADRAPTFDPGSRQEYSNTNGLLVGEVIRKVTGRSLASVLDETIVRRLGLRHMYLYGGSTAARDRARGYSGAENWGAAPGTLVDCSAADDALPDSADGSVVASAGDLLRYHEALRNGELLSERSWAAMRTVSPGLDNGLGYLVGQGPFGRYEGNVGKAMGHIAANVYYGDHGTYVVMMGNRSDVPLPLAPFLKQWFAWGNE